jgi:hypothetical protein
MTAQAEVLLENNLVQQLAGLGYVRFYCDELVSRDFRHTIFERTTNQTNRIFDCINK